MTAADPFDGKALAPDACPRCGHASHWHEDNGRGSCQITGPQPSDGCPCLGPPTMRVELQGPTIPITHELHKDMGT